MIKTSLASGFQTYRHFYFGVSKNRTSLAFRHLLFGGNHSFCFTTPNTSFLVVLIQFKKSEVKDSIWPKMNTKKYDSPRLRRQI